MSNPISGPQLNFRSWDFEGMHTHLGCVCSVNLALQKFTGAQIRNSRKSRILAGKKGIWIAHLWEGGFIAWDKGHARLVHLKRKVSTKFEGFLGLSGRKNAPRSEFSVSFLTHKKLTWNFLRSEWPKNLDFWGINPSSLRFKMSHYPSFLDGYTKSYRVWHLPPCNDFSGWEISQKTRYLAKIDPNRVVQKISIFEGSKLIPLCAFCARNHPKRMISDRGVRWATFP